MSLFDENALIALGTFVSARPWTVLGAYCLAKASAPWTVLGAYCLAKASAPWTVLWAYCFAKAGAPWTPLPQNPTVLDCMHTCS